MMHYHCLSMPYLKEMLGNLGSFCADWADSCWLSRRFLRLRLSPSRLGVLGTLIDW